MRSLFTALFLSLATACQLEAEPGGSSESSESGEPCSSEGCGPSSSSESGAPPDGPASFDADIEPQAAGAKCTSGVPLTTFSCQCLQPGCCGVESICAIDGGPGNFGDCRVVPPHNGMLKCTQCRPESGFPPGIYVDMPDGGCEDGWVPGNCQRYQDGEWHTWAPCGGGCTGCCCGGSLPCSSECD